jgi:ribosomal protein L16 Arg81 hydroxylase
MTATLTTFDEIMAPFGAGRFLEEHLGKAPLHLEGGADKWRPVMNWDVLNRLLGMASIWSTTSLPLVIDKEPVQATAYATPAVGRDGGQVLRPEPPKVQSWLKRGATLVANDIDQLTPELRAFAKAMETALGGKVQGNLYLSSKRRQGFRVHFDTHDVFAIHVEGEKTWFVFEGRAEDPIAHPMFEGLTAEHHEQAKGKLWREVRMRPGDLLYLPRGQYHYALADEGATVHIAMGVTYPIGIDVVSYLYQRLMAEPLSRANLPRGDAGALQDRLRALGVRATAILAEPRTLDDIKAFQAGFHYPRDEYGLPELIDGAEIRFRVRAKGVRLVEHGGRAGLAREGTREAVEVPIAVKPQIAWVLARGEFSRREIGAAFSGEPAAKVEKLLGDLERMAVIEAVP